MLTQESRHLTPFDCKTIHIRLMPEKPALHAHQAFCFHLALHNSLPIQNKAALLLPEYSDKAPFLQMTGKDYLVPDPVKIIILQEPHTPPYFVLSASQILQKHLRY